MGKVVVAPGSKISQSLAEHLVKTGGVKPKYATKAQVDEIIAGKKTVKEVINNNQKSSMPQDLKQNSIRALQKAALDTKKRILNLRRNRATNLSIRKETERLKNLQRSVLTLKKIRRSPTKEIKKFDKEKEEVNIQKRVGEVQAIEQPKGRISKLIRKIEDLQKIQATKSQRTKQRDLKNELSLIATTAGVSIINTGKGFVDIPKSVISLAKNPKKVKEIPGSIKRGGENFGKILKVSPTEAFAKVGTEILLLKGTEEAFRVAGKVTGKAAESLDPKFKKIERGKIDIKTSKGKTTLRVGGPVKRIAEPLREQAKLAGKRVTAVSAQADSLVGLIKRKRIIRKPIPGEEELSRSTKSLLNKFDKGTITKKELRKLDSEVNLLERSFFADPRGRFRPSRLGSKQEKAKLLDILSGDVTLRTNKPQVLVFKDIRVQRFPKSLEDIEKALKSGKKLTSSQAKRLLEFQTKKSGEFKPIGALSKEPEITLAPGEIIKKKKTVARAKVNGKTVEFVEAEVVKPSKETKGLLEKEAKGTITKKELRKLERKLEKETGFKDIKVSEGKVSYRKGNLRKKLSLPKRIPRSISKRKTLRTTPRSRSKIRKRIINKVPTRRGGTRKTTRGSQRIIRRGKKGTSKSSTSKRPGKTTRKTTIPLKPSRRPPRRSRIIKPPVKAIKGKSKRSIKRTGNNKRGYNVYARPLKSNKKGKQPRLIRVNKVPLSKARAKDLRAYITDTSLSRTAKIIPTTKKAQKPKLEIPRGYAQRTRKKFRSYRIIKGKKRSLGKGTVIERSRNLLDTTQEKRRIGLLRRIKQISKKSKKKRGKR